MEYSSHHSKGGLTAAANMTPEERKARAQKGGLTRWGLKAIKKGNFKHQFGFDAECYVLNDAKKTPVMSARGMAAALGLAGSTGTALKSITNSKAVAESSVGVEIAQKIANPLIFKDSSVGAKSQQPRPIHGYDVALLIDICNALVESESLGRLAASQVHLAKNAKVLLAASAKAGIQNLVYALAGYSREDAEIVEAFRAFVQEEARKYEKEFPPEIYLQWARLYGIPSPVRGKNWKHRHLTIDHVYRPLAKSDGRLLALLKEARDSDGSGQKLFQFLNEVGAKALRFHLGRIMEMAESSTDAASYENKIAERFGGQTTMALQPSVTLSAQEEA